MSSIMRAGDLTRYVAVQSQSASQDSFGQQVLTWATIKSVYAAINPASGKELFTSSVMTTEITHLITVRYDAALWANPKAAASYRILYGARVFEIQDILNTEEANRLITLGAIEGPTNG